MLGTFRCRFDDAAYTPLVIRVDTLEKLLERLCVRLYGRTEIRPVSQQTGQRSASDVQFPFTQIRYIERELQTCLKFSSGGGRRGGGVDILFYPGLGIGVRHIVHSKFPTID